VAVDVAWPDLVRDLAQVQAVTVTLDGERHRLGTDLTGSAHPAFAAALPEQADVKALCSTHPCTVAPAQAA
jgi:hypothetical protein